MDAPEQDKILPADALEAAVAETVLSREAAEQFRKGAISRKLLEPFAKSLKRISEIYVSRGEGACVAPFNEKEAESYALYFSLINFTKVLHLLQELPPDFPRAGIRALDFGCGPGTASMAMAAFFGEIKICACDHSKAMVALAEKLFARFRETAGVSGGTEFNAGLSLSQNAQSYDLVVAANVINEFDPDSQLKMLQALVSSLSPGGILLLLDPALQATTRRLMALRDSLLSENPRLMPLFPCTRRDACPMLKESPTDWCHTNMHEGRGWRRSELVKTLDEMTGFNKHQLKYAAFIFRNGGEMKEGFRVITDTEKERRGHSALLCGKDLYGTVLLPKSSKNESNAQFSRLRSFDLVQISGVGEDRVLEEGSEVRKLA